MKLKSVCSFNLFLFITFLFTFSSPAYAEDYRWDLISAMTAGDLITVDSILKENVNSMTAAEKRLVMNFAVNYSAGENTVKVLELLLKYGIKPGSFDLYTAIDRNRQNSAIQFLLQNGASPNGEILLLAMEKQRFDLARQFIEAGADVNYSYPRTSSYADGMTALLYAAKWGNLDLAELLVKKGANVNVQAFNGDSALSLAQQNNNGTIEKLLIENGAAEQANMPLPNSGIGGLGNQIFNFQPGSYHLSYGSRSIRFTGSAVSGSISYVDTSNYRTDSGIYRIAGNNLTLILNAQTYIYRLDSDESFSGNGETWIRVRN